CLRYGGGRRSRRQCRQRFGSWLSLVPRLRPALSAGLLRTSGRVRGSARVCLLSAPRLPGLLRLRLWTGRHVLSPAPVLSASALRDALLLCAAPRAPLLLLSDLHAFPLATSQAGLNHRSASPSYGRRVMSQWRIYFA